MWDGVGNLPDRLGFGIVQDRFGPVSQITLNLLEDLWSWARRRRAPIAGELAAVVFAEHAVEGECRCALTGGTTRAGLVRA